MLVVEGIYSAGSLTLTRSTVNGNSTAIGGLPQYGSYRGDGGGILSKGPLTLTDSTVTGNLIAHDAHPRRS